MVGVHTPESISEKGNIAIREVKGANLLKIHAKERARQFKAFHVTERAKKAVSGLPC